MIYGSYVAIVTPFTNGEIDKDALADLIEFQIENGTHGIVPCGTTGESATMSHDEHNQVVEFTVQVVNKRVPVVAGTGSNNTAEAIYLSQHAKKVGADACLLITPYYNKPTQEGLFRHFEAVDRQVGLPMVVYNIASRTGVNITPSTMARIAKLKSAVAVKEASGDIVQVAEMMGLCEGDIDFLAGDDTMVLPVLALGGKGVISVINNLLPAEMAGMWDDWQAGRRDEARLTYLRLLPLMKAMFIETNPGPIKKAMELKGLIKESGMRLPLCEMSSENLEKLKAALIQAGVLS